MSVFSLKLLAVVTMLIDHLGILLRSKGLVDYDVYLMMRTLGRFAFPIYAFLLAEGYRHLRRKPEGLRVHLTLLVALTVISEPLFDFFGEGVLQDPASQSVMVTLTLGFGGLWLSEALKERPMLRVSVLVSACCLGYYLHANSQIAGVALVFACFFCLERRGDRPYWQRLLGMLGVLGFYYLLYCWVISDFGGPGDLWRMLKAMGVYGLPHLLLVPLLACYDGRLGPRNKLLHRSYQWFYPAHLAVLCLLNTL